MLMACPLDIHTDSYAPSAFAGGNINSALVSNIDIKYFISSVVPDVILVILNHKTSPGDTERHESRHLLGRY